MHPTPSRGSRAPCAPTQGAAACSAVHTTAGARCGTTCARIATTRHEETSPMHDIRAIRDNPDAFDAALRARRGAAPVVRRSWPSTRPAARRSPPPKPRRPSGTPPRRRWAPPRHAATRPSSNACARWSPPRRTRSPAWRTRRRPRTPRLTDLLDGACPTCPLDDVPDGTDEADNVEIHRWGTPRAFDFTPLEHFDIPAVKPGMDFETAAKLSGVALRGAEGRHRPPAPRAGAVHAGHPHRRRTG